MKFQLQKEEPGHIHGDDCDLFHFKFTIKHYHNHPILSSGALKFHPVNRETKRKYLELFSQDLSASEALHKYRDYLVEQYGPDEYVKLSGDRSVDPDPQWVFREHSKYILSKYGRLNSPESFQLAESTGCPAKLFPFGYLLFCWLLLMEIAKVGTFLKNPGNLPNDRHKNFENRFRFS